MYYKSSELTDRRLRLQARCHQTRMGINELLSAGDFVFNRQQKQSNTDTLNQDKVTLVIMAQSFPEVKLFINRKTIFNENKPSLQAQYLLTCINFSLRAIQNIVS